MRILPEVLLLDPGELGRLIGDANRRLQAAMTLQDLLADR